MRIAALCAKQCQIASFLAIKMAALQIIKEQNNKIAANTVEVRTPLEGLN